MLNAIEPPSLYIVLDACVLAGYYAPQTLADKFPCASTRIENLVDSVKRGCSPHLRLLTPEICVSEAQTVLSKYANMGWSGPKKRQEKAIHGKSYKRLQAEMRKDLHGGRHIESVPLARYHVLSKHLVTPVDHNSRIRNLAGQVQRSLGSLDQLIAGSSTWLARFLGREHVVVLTTDYRLYKVLEKCAKVKDAQARKWGLLDIADDIGIEWSRGIYPQVVHLDHANDRHLQKLFTSWPLPTKLRTRNTSRKQISKADIDVLYTRYQAVGMYRDRLPYTKQMTALTRSFNQATGHDLDERGVWNLLVSRLKRGDGKLRDKP